MKRLIPTILLAVAGCGSSSAQTELAPAEKTEVGRYQFHPAAGEMPAVLLDTASGCIEIIEKFTLDDKPKEAVWIRRVSDEVTEGTPKRCNVKRLRYNPATGKLEPIDGSKPTVSNR